MYDFETFEGFFHYLNKFGQSHYLEKMVWGTSRGSGKGSVSERGGMALLERRQRVAGAQKVRNGKNNG